MLARAGFVVKGRSAQWRPCRPEPTPLAEADAWTAWGATDGWPQVDLEHLDQSARVTLRLKQSSSGTTMTIHVELPADLPDDGVTRLVADVSRRHEGHGRPPSRRARPSPG